MLVRSPRRAAAGFTLIELLITLVIVSVGMLGMAKLEAAAVAESQTSRMRSLLTFQAESLTALMQANRTYWGSTTAAAGFKLTAGSSTVTDNGAVKMAAPPSGSCIGTATNTTVCTTAAMLAYDDVNVWVTNFAKQFPGVTVTVVCTLTASQPTTCDVTMAWAERFVAINRSTAPSATAPQANLVLHVQP